MKFTSNICGVPGTTVRIASSDVVQQFSSTIYNLSSLYSAIYAVISCEDYNVRFAFNVDPTQGANAIGHILYADDYLILESSKAIREFRFIDEVSGQNGVIQVTPYFEIGVQV